jgi:hypothetical protein
MKIDAYETVKVGKLTRSAMVAVRVQNRHTTRRTNSRGSPTVPSSGHPVRQLEPLT